MVDVEQNEVSIFLAGYMAGLALSGKYTSEELRAMVIDNIEFANEWRALFRAYKDGVTDEPGLDNMFEYINSLPK
jgi:hypothetical protein